MLLYKINVGLLFYIGALSPLKTMVVVRNPEIKSNIILLVLHRPIIFEIKLICLFIKLERDFLITYLQKFTSCKK